ncbi:MAG: hypothetical protein V3V13_12480 [Paracoccaceae bacterium]
MSDKSRKTSKKGPAINLAGLKSAETKPDMAVTALTRSGKILHSAMVEKDGTFALPAKALKEASQIKIGAAEGQENALSLSVDKFKAMLDVGVIDIGRGIWGGWFPFTHCETGHVRVCHHNFWWQQNLVQAAMAPVKMARKSLSLSSVMFEKPTLSLDALVLWPWRCSPVCQGTVTVYRRTCCCKPWIFRDPRFEDLLIDLEDIVTGVPEIGPGGPDPDPAPIDTGVFVNEGALNTFALRAPQDLATLRKLPAMEVAAYVNARPYLLCRGFECGDPVRVGSGELGHDGRFNVCWNDWFRLLPVGCHDEYAYVVTQPFGWFNIVIYNGVAAGDWHHAGDDPMLTSHSELAYGCRKNPDGDGVYLDIIGDTSAHELITPDADGPDSVANPAYNSGLVFPAADAAAAKGANRDRNWGGTLKLSYMFPEGLQDAGAKYYRISVVAADANGNPSGVRNNLTAGLSWNKTVSTGAGTEIVPVSLGPVSVSGQNALFEIPYDTNPTTDWNAGQYHAHLNTEDAHWIDPDVRHLVMLELFDNAGKRLRPNATAATGLGGTEGPASFTYERRYQEVGATANVPHGALTHMFWWDNREVAVKVEDLRLNGAESTNECQFLIGDDSSTFGIGYRAYHPNPMFQLYHKISWHRGLGGMTGSLTPAVGNPDNVGKPPLPVGASPTNTFAQMLATPVGTNPLSRCAFTVGLTAWNKRTDGDSFSNAYESDSAAFVIDRGDLIPTP